MDLSIMAVTQLSFNFTTLPDVLYLVVRSRIYTEIPILIKYVPINEVYGEIQLENSELSPKDISDEEIIKRANSFMDELWENGGVDPDRLFYSKRGTRFEVLFHKRIVPVVESDQELYVVDSHEIPGTNHARVIKCSLKLI